MNNSVGNEEFNVAAAQSVVVEPSNNKNVVDQSMEGIYFQEEILMDILSRLPLRSLYRFKYVSKFWGTLIFNPYFKMKIKLSDDEMDACRLNIIDYLLHLVKLYNGREADWDEFCDKHPMPKHVREFLQYDLARDVHPSVDENSIEGYTDDEEFDIEDVFDFESSDESDSDDEDDDDESVDEDDGDEGKPSAEERSECAYNQLCYFLHMVPLFEELYKNRKADLKKIQEKHPLSRHARELLGYDSGSDVPPSEVDNTTDERAAAEEHDSKEVDAVKLGN